MQEAWGGKGALGVVCTWRQQGSGPLGVSVLTVADSMQRLQPDWEEGWPLLCSQGLKGTREEPRCPGRVMGPEDVKTLAAVWVELCPV